MASKIQKLAHEEQSLKVREAIKLVRQHFTGYGAADGYGLGHAAIERLPGHLRRSVLRKAAKVQRLLATPHVVVTPKSAAEEKVLRRETGQGRMFRGQKNYIVHVPDPERSTAEIVGGRLQIRTRYRGKAEVEEQMFRFPHRAKTPDELLTMLEAMLPDMPTTGTFVLQTSIYGDTGDPADHGQLMTLLREYITAYDTDKDRDKLLNLTSRITGFRWSRSKLAGKTVTTHRSKARAAQRQANRERRQQLEREARKRVKKG